MVSKYGDLMLPETFPDKVIPHIDFTDEAVVRFDIPVVTRLLTELAREPRQIVALYYMNFLHLWRGDEPFEMNFEFT